MRGVGLSIGVELASGALAARVVDGLRDRRFLVSATGLDGRVIKVRPPLPFGREHSDLLVAALADSLAAID